ncbi:hypothetical protein OBBRIDRAFT_237224 [Obba rivulosa]|uniref:L-lactate dehydrogenase (cytochrome) n=1 Tax=Obba rivulosa TaxID=1052685 RepID=A0A8E2DVI0_9APHY|nr:hypothetical protein OBBRIDRAFT_237224 [Obba rivulosa]
MIGHLPEKRSNRPSAHWSICANTLRLELFSHCVVMSKSWSLKEVAKHNTQSSCWVIIKSKVYDVTDFLHEHPGGAQIILRHAGRDATTVYEPIHPPDALDKSLSLDKHLGDLDTAAARQITQEKESRKKTIDEIRMEEGEARKPPLSRILNLRELEEVAKSVLSYKTWAFYSSASDDEITHYENMRAFSRFFFHPRVLVPVSRCDPSTTILGFKSSIPVFVSGASLARLGHPLGEANITRGAGRTNVIQMVSSYASLSYEQISESRITASQPLFFQLYKHKDDKVAETHVREVENLGYNAIFLTVDAVVISTRTRDVRAPFVLEEQERETEQQLASGRHASGQEMPLRPSDADIKSGEEDGNLLGTSGALTKSKDQDMSWKRTIPWLRSVTKLPIALKGIQCVEDAVLAAEAGVDAILISNHGGRQMEYSLPSIEVLYKLREQRPDVFDKLEVYVDGGIRRGTDVLKALCLGAKAVGLGRPFMYAQSAYGEEGVVKAVQILEREIVTSMRLLGATSVKDLVPEMVERVDWQPRFKL